jgi:Carboxypeptidase regulatory-like domain
MKYALFAILAIVVLTQPLSYGQAVSGTINGFVKDPSGAVVVGANVTATNAATGVTTSASSNEAGFYSIPQLIPGGYSVRISATGFKQLDRTGIVLDVDSVVRADVELALGSTNETVTVSSDPAVLKTEKADLGGVISDRTLTRLPILSRNVRVN